LCEVALVSREKATESVERVVERPTRRVALMLGLPWPGKRPQEVYAGIQRFAAVRGWVTIIDECAHDNRAAIAGVIRQVASPV
jgi:hypothetical protein